jgi:hypothetical protein
LVAATPRISYSPGSLKTWLAGNSERKQVIFIIKLYTTAIMKAAVLIYKHITEKH